MTLKTLAQARTATLAAVMALAALAAMPAPALAANVEIEAEGPVIELSIYESIEAEPDLVTIGAGVTSEAATAVDAMRANASQMQRVIDRLKALRVAEKDIQTQGINLNARYDYNRETSQNEFKGYTVSNRVSVRLRDVAETGEVLDALVVAGANDLSGPNFSIEDDTEAKAKARASAIARANQRAAEYAAMLGYDGYKVLTISESIERNSGYTGPKMRGMAEASSVARAPVEPGLVSTGVALQIKFELIDDEAEVAAEGEGA